MPTSGCSVSSSELLSLGFISSSLMSPKKGFLKGAKLTFLPPDTTRLPLRPKPLGTFGLQDSVVLLGSLGLEPSVAFVVLIRGFGFEGLLLGSPRLPSVTGSEDPVTILPAGSKT